MVMMMEGTSSTDSSKTYFAHSATVQLQTTFLT